MLNCNNHIHYSYGRRIVFKCNKNTFEWLLCDPKWGILIIYCDDFVVMRFINVYVSICNIIYSTIYSHKCALFNVNKQHFTNHAVWLEIVIVFFFFMYFVLLSIHFSHRPYLKMDKWKAYVWLINPKERKKKKVEIKATKSKQKKWNEKNGGKCYQSFAVSSWSCISFFFILLFCRKHCKKWPKMKRKERN